VAAGWQKLSKVYQKKRLEKNSRKSQEIEQFETLRDGVHVAAYWFRV
jgi:hypothetical protein